MEELIDMPMQKLRRCPRCGGNMFLERDMDSLYEVCLQCSYQRELGIIAKFQGQPSEIQREPALAGAPDSMSS